MIAHNPLHGSGQAALPHPGWDRTQALYRWAAGSCRFRLLVGDCRCLVPRLGQFPTSPRLIPDGGIAPVRLGIAAFPLESSMMASHVKRWHASPGYHHVGSKARRVRLHQNTPATVCRLVCVARPPLPRAPLLRRHYPPSSLLRAHAQVLWPPCRFDLGLIGNGLRRLCHPRLVHRTVLALTMWLSPKVSCPLRRVLARCMWSISSQATAAFASRDGSARSKSSRKRLHAGTYFRRCRHSLRLRPSRSLAPLVAPTQLHVARALSLELAWDSFPLPKSSQLPG